MRRKSKGPSAVSFLSEPVPANGFHETLITVFCQEDEHSHLVRLHFVRDEVIAV